MFEFKKYQDNVRDLLGSDFNFHVDRAHAGKPVHIDLTTKLPGLGGSDKVEVDFNGKIICGSTQIGKNPKMKW